MKSLGNVSGCEAVKSEPKPAIPIEYIAAICHEANRIYCLAIGDQSQPLYEHAPTWQKESAIAGVQDIIDRGKNGPFYADDQDQHNRWMDRKLKEGWRYGPVKDADKKEHPCLLSYASLPEDQKRKDRLFGAIVGALVYRT